MFNLSTTQKKYVTVLWQSLLGGVVTVAFYRFLLEFLFRKALKCEEHNFCVAEQVCYVSSFLVLYLIMFASSFYMTFDLTKWVFFWSGFLPFLAEISIKEDWQILLGLLAMAGIVVFKQWLAFRKSQQVETPNLPYVQLKGVSVESNETQKTIQVLSGAHQ